MSVKSFIQCSALALAIAFTAPVFAAEDASMHDVYVAAEAGKFHEAQTMMDKVLRDHPNSAKAHYVEAELLAKQGQLTSAATELSTAERLQPGLSFAKPQAVQNLKTLIASSHQTTHTSSIQGSPLPASNGLPWGAIFLGIGLIVFIVMAARLMARRNVPVVYPTNNYPGYGPGANPQGYGAPPPYGAAPQPMGTSMGGGMGSGILGGLATGAALGAGMVAGEALMHHFTDGGEHSSGLVNDARANDTWQTPADDMGGSDFGILDNSSWDDSSSGGGDDWT